MAKNRPTVSRQVAWFNWPGLWLPVEKYEVSKDVAPDPLHTLGRLDSLRSSYPDFSWAFLCDPRRAARCPCLPFPATREVEHSPVPPILHRVLCACCLRSFVSALLNPDTAWTPIPAQHVCFPHPLRILRLRVTRFLSRASAWKFKCATARLWKFPLWLAHMAFFMRSFLPHWSKDDVRSPSPC